jgi:galactonate dehydratase
MTITDIESFIVDAGWRPWIFVKVSTDEGFTGWGECSDGRNPLGVVATIEDLKSRLIGQDPRAFEMRFQDMRRGTIASPSGIGCKAIAGIELGLLDIKAKALGISVTELFGGPTRESVRVYWSHCGTSRVAHDEHLDVPAVRSLDDVTALGKEVVSRGFTALKTNILLPEEGRCYFPGFGGPPGSTDGTVSRQLLRHIETLIATFRDAVGPDVDINLDLNFNFKPEACTRIAQALEPYDLLWLEIDMYEPDAIRQIKDSTRTKICTGENFYWAREFLPYFERRAADFFMVDVPWNGFSPAKKVCDLADIYQINMSPHNYYSHLSSFISTTLCATIPNVSIMEIDIDDVPWKEELVTVQPEIIDGYMTVPTGPGWGTEPIEEALMAHPWEDRKSNW